MLARERRQKLAEALARLPDRQRSVFMLSHYEGCTSREVSAITGLNESTVRVHLFRAIRKLRGMLTEGATVGLLNPHLEDDDFADVWSARLDDRRRGIGPRPPKSHLRKPARSAVARYASFASWLDGIRVDAQAEADEIFGRERLATQQTQIFRRLEALEHPARVIAFPTFARPVPVQPTGRRRWCAAAAASDSSPASASGQLIDFRIGADTSCRRRSRRSQIARAQPVPPRRARPGVQPVPRRRSDEAFTRARRLGVARRFERPGIAASI